MNNDFAIESFIDYCDEMIITTEAFDAKKFGKSVWEGIVRIFRKFATWFKNLLLNINYFKNAELSERMNKDMLHVLQVSQARTEDLFKVIPQIYTMMKLFTRKTPDTDTSIDGAAFSVAGDNILVSRMTTFKDQIDRLSIDISDNMSTAKDTDEYKRIMDNAYTDNKKLIPLSNIIPDMKKSNTGLTDAENHLSKMQSMVSDISNNPSATKLLNMITKFFNRVIAYYNFRISLLTKYFTAAKASLTGIKNNISELKDKENKSRNKFKSKAKLKVAKLSDEDYRRLEKLYSDAKEIDTYQEYKPLYDEIIKILKIKPIVIDGLIFTKSSHTVVVYGADESDSKIPIAKGQKLYHTSTDENITKLEPRWKTPAGVLFPTPRVYFHTTVPLDRYANKADSGSGGNVYELVSNPTEAYIDKELGTTAVYVVTHKELPVKKINYNEWKKKKDIDLKLN